MNLCSISANSTRQYVSNAWLEHHYSRINILASPIHHSKLDQDTGTTKGKVHFISLGCARNRVDTEVMLGTLLDESWQVAEEPDQADVIIINTCGFITAAKEESIDTILSAVEHKKNNPQLIVVVAGCLTQRYKNQLVKGLPEVDLFVGTDEFPRISEFLAGNTQETALHAKRSHYIYSGELPKKNTLSRVAAYVKIAEGCQHHCSFCIIPAIRGRLRSRPVMNVVDEVDRLVKTGVVEVNLIAQDLAAYGREQGRDDLLYLLKNLASIDQLQWVRLLYMYPENISELFLQFFAENHKMVKYLDIPIQHASDDILNKMNRGISEAQLRSIIAKVRSYVPDIAIRTSVMVGFPGESEQDFQRLLRFVEDMSLEHLGCFAYSQEEGTVAGRMPDQIPEEIKTQRRHQVMELQKEISARRLAKMVGNQYPVLIEGLSKETDLLAQGRLSTQAPEVDGIVYINDGPFVTGKIQTVEITESHDYDLVGKVIDPP